MQEEFPNSPFDDSETLTFTLKKVYFVGKFSHWEGELVYNDSHTEASYIEVTGPNALGVLDELTDYLVTSDSAIDKKWLNQDANSKEN